MLKCDFIMKVIFFIFLAAFFLILYLADTGQNRSALDMLGHLEYGDKYAHFLIYGLLSIQLNLVLKLRVISLFSIKIYYGSLITLIFSILEELSQGFIPYRNLDFGDFLANTFGILTFFVITKLIEHRQKGTDTEKTIG